MVYISGSGHDHARLTGGYLDGADLRKTNITKDLIKVAYIGEDSLLPDSITYKDKQ